MYKQLEENPPSPKFHVFLEAVGITDVKFYTHSEKYLAPGGIFVSVGPYPHGFSGFLESVHLVLEAFIRPRFLGGVKRKFMYVMHALYPLFELNDAISLSTKLPFEDFKKYAQYVEDGEI